MNNSIITLVYSHGRHGSPWYGDKILALRPVALKLGINFLAVDYENGTSLDQLENKLISLCQDRNLVPGDLILYGSSMGGYVATKVSKILEDMFANEESVSFRERKLARRKLLGIFLTAPAFYIKPEFYGTQKIEPANTRISIVHGYNDDLIPYQNSIKFSNQFNSELHLIKGGHRLNSQIEKIEKLFSIFLNECIDEAKLSHTKWLEENPSPPLEDD